MVKMNKKNILILGDIITLALITLIGFVSHGESDSSYLPRFFAAFIPLLVSWFLLITWFGLLNQEITNEAKKLLLIPLAMIFVIPLAAFLRGLILNSPIQPMFVIAFYATNTIGILIWRGIYIFIAKRTIHE
jgi:hypothetical protein